MNGLRACDLRYGSRYYSPLGNLCELLAPAANENNRNLYNFRYVGRDREDDGFSLTVNNVHTIGTLREAVANAPMTIPVYIKSRGIAA